MVNVEKIKDGCRQFVAGGSAGLVEVSIMHPLDLLKTRLQIGSHYKGLADCVTQTLEKEGIWSFYKGILPPLLAETPKRATKFFTFEVYKDLFNRPSISPAIGLSLAGLCCGLTEAVVVNPFELVKVRLQAERNVKLSEQKSAWAVAKAIARRDGIGSRGLYCGLTSTLARNGTWNMFYFGLYHNLKQFTPDAKDNPALNLLVRILLGFTAGASASIINIPFDVAKSRIQGPQPEPGVVKYKGCLQSIQLISKEEGRGALFKGLLPKVMRLGPGGAIMLIVYESVFDWLKEHT